MENEFFIYSFLLKPVSNRFISCDSVKTASDGKSEAVFYTFGEFYRRMNGFGESLQVKNADYSETSGVER